MIGIGGETGQDKSSTQAASSSSGMFGDKTINFGTTSTASTLIPYLAIVAVLLLALGGRRRK